jgi:hypothetical protein
MFRALLAHPQDALHGRRIGGFEHSAFLLEIHGQRTTLVTKESSMLAGQFHPNVYWSFIPKEGTVFLHESNSYQHHIRFKKLTPVLFLVAFLVYIDFQPHS